ncbi:MAG: dihydrodipicolinate reductase [Pseudomonadota bacterium]
MAPIKVMVCGLPGNMATRVAYHVVKEDGFELVPFSLTGSEIADKEVAIDSFAVRLVRPNERDSINLDSLRQSQTLIAIDYTHPGAVNENAKFYCEKSIPFVMGTTGGDRSSLVKTVEASSIPAVIAPNMAKQIVGFQAMMEFAAKEFPNLFKGYSLEITESHQKGKADTSGTAKAMVGCFNQLGVRFDASDISMIRDPEIQKHQMGVPDEYLSGHGWHTYTLVSGDQTVKFQFVHNVNGREVYAGGTIDAVRFLACKILEGITGKAFSMIDVLRGE